MRNQSRSHNLRHAQAGFELYLVKAPETSATTEIEASANSLRYPDTFRLPRCWRGMEIPASLKIPHESGKPSGFPQNHRGYRGIGLGPCHTLIRGGGGIYCNFTAKMSGSQKIGDDLKGTDEAAVGAREIA